MKILHSSDWHLGNRMMERSRIDEFERFLSWMMVQIEQEKPDALLISGDIFDVSSPGETVRELFSDFLSRVDETGCHQVILTAGNHDGVAQLNSIKPLLKRYHVHLVATLSVESANDCLIPLFDNRGTEIGLVCAVPYLRPIDVSVAVPEDDNEGSDLSYIRGIEAVYKRVAELASEWKEKHPDLPVIAMGHLSVSGVETTSSTRRLIGTLDVVNASIFSRVFDYVALGHIHKPSSMDQGRIQYCGSPLAMGIDETDYTHQIICWENGSVTQIPVPEMTLFRRFDLKSDEESPLIINEIKALYQKFQVPVWVLIEYVVATVNHVSSVRDQLNAINSDILQYRLVAKREQMNGESRASFSPEDRLTQYTPELLFERRLEEYEKNMGTPIEKQKRGKIVDLFKQIVSEISAD